MPRFLLVSRFETISGGARIPRTHGGYIDRQTRPWSERDERLRTRPARPAAGLVRLDEEPVAEGANDRRAKLSLPGARRERLHAGGHGRPQAHPADRKSVV